MARNKVKLAFIENNASRKASLNKRKKGLSKKLNEISTLCGIQGCAIIYSPEESTPEVWPTNSDVRQVISEFHALPQDEQRKHMVDQVAFTRKRIEKTFNQLHRQLKKNTELEMTDVMFRCSFGKMEISNPNIPDLNDLDYMITKYLLKVNHRMEILDDSGQDIGESSNVVAVVDASKGNGTIPDRAPTSTPFTSIIEVGSSSSSMVAATSPNPIPKTHHD